jgi:drug/metabolite transporter (DMT)-like permease
VYSLRGKHMQIARPSDPTQVTAGNFLRAVPMALGLSLVMHGHQSLDGNGVALAVASGAVASGLGYAVWYRVLPVIQATHAATVQLSVPVIAALGGVVLLGEPLALSMVLASVAILGGIALVIRNRQ